MTALAAFADSLNPNLAANSNDNESESTGWMDPSFKVTYIASTSNPARGQFFIEALNHLSTDGMYSFGTFPPFISFTNSRPTLPSTAGSKVKTISANLPRPPFVFCILLGDRQH